jgi:transcriptional regulator with XRE-family HTH domain
VDLKDRIQAARVARGLKTQRELAELADVSLSMVSLLERGEKTDMRASMASDLAVALGCSVDWLLNGTGAAPEGVAA